MRFGSGGIGVPSGVLSLSALRWQHSRVSARKTYGKRIALSPPRAQSSSTPGRLHVRPITLALTLLVLTAACENSTNPLLFGQGGGGGGAITQAQAAGDWSFTVTKTTTLACTGGSLADGSRLTAHLDVLADGTVNGPTSLWH